MAFKETIRRETGDFLRNIPNNNNSFGFQNQNTYYTAAQNSFSSGLNQKKALTGAAEAILPMQIVTAKVNNVNGQETLERLAFTLLINPDSWNHGKTFATQSAYTRKGWRQQLWGPNQDTISSTGRSAAFMTPAAGLDNFTENYSFGYLNFMALIAAYRNNGYTFEDYTAANELTRVIKTVQGVQIMFDNEIFMGHFTNFTIDEVEETPYIQNYNFEFVISALTGAEFEVRGHYKPIPQNFAQLDLGTAGDPNTIVFVSDTFMKGPSKPIIVPTYTEDVTTPRIWERKTGLPWVDAIRLGYTNGSSTSNSKLLNLLLTKRWNSSTKKFE